MEETRLDDAEAVRLLWDTAVVMAREARLLTETTDRLTHKIRAFAAEMVEARPIDPRELLAELGAVAALCEGVRGARGGMEEAASALGFAFVPNASPHPLVQAHELAELRASPWHTSQDSTAPSSMSSARVHITVPPFRFMCAIAGSLLWQELQAAAVGPMIQSESLGTDVR